MWCLIWPPMVLKWTGSGPEMGFTSLTKLMWGIYKHSYFVCIKQGFWIFKCTQQICQTENEILCKYMKCVFEYNLLNERKSKFEPIPIVGSHSKWPTNYVLWNFFALYTLFSYSPNNTTYCKASMLLFSVHCTGLGQGSIWSSPTSNLSIGVHFSAALTKGRGGCCSGISGAQSGRSCLFGNTLCSS